MEAGLSFRPYRLEMLRDPTGSPEWIYSVTVALRISLSLWFKGSPVAMDASSLYFLNK
jgi:hypothetical protein